MERRNKEVNRAYNEHKNVLRLRPSPSSSGKRMQSEVTPLQNKELPFDVFGIISKKLDLFELAGVCKNWKDFMTCKVPLLVQMSPYAEKMFFFRSLAEKKVYQSNADYSWGLSYCGNSSGYLIMAVDSSLVLMNPFTRRKKSINIQSILPGYYLESRACHPLLAFNLPKVQTNLDSSFLKLVKSEVGLLVVHYKPGFKFDVYKIDFSTMEYVKLETLGDLALFVTLRTRCYALSNPGRWEYESNSIYYIDGYSSSAKCNVYSGESEPLRPCTMGLLP